ncbi:MAG: hypothetical protein A3F54_01790 [Candidatus Kerfeldbacteria bacterium RIFCSPHIGHO2_12_FULL_48_17]|uniref:Opine dehydrogenase domain-containing protein n=1 Tax=Candidatus Kerfeldbacteria bacterium RIFCSPHIGHO2_12_FULL_48_17 TaxID=1798542 RepID=A0A1G2AYU4_9BACT|nr:MAG: hypothetical protein A3F54_01790 [Candidatus Kerfeldbacteria bacterium RIFCSPHIGHO2_12_FULL_48_17]
MKILIIGTGPGGTSLAFDLLEQGVDASVTDMPVFQTNLDCLLKNDGVIEVFGIRPGKARLQVVHFEKIDDYDYWFVVTHAFAHLGISKILETSRKKCRGVIFMPGNLGSLFFHSCRTSHPDIALVETNTLPYGCRITSKNPWHILRSVWTQSVLFDSEIQKLPELIPLLRLIIPKLAVGASKISVALSNPNPLFHPTISLLNAARIENERGDFIFYKDGLSSGVMSVLREKNKERMNILRVIKEKGFSWEEFTGTILSHDDSGTLEEKHFLECGAFAKFLAPENFGHRYITEDVPFGTVLWEAIAQLYNIHTPTLSSEIDLLSAIAQQPFRQQSLHYLPLIKKQLSL